MTELFDWVAWILVCLLCIALLLLFFKYNHLKNDYLKKSSRDEVTGLYNQISILEQLHYEFDVATRYQHPLTIGMLFSPDLKHAQKRYPQASLNRYFQKITKILQTELRGTDHIGRYDYDRFLLILNNTNSHNARAVFNRIIYRVENIKLHGRSLSYYLGIGNRHAKTANVKSLLRESKKGLEIAMLPNKKNIQGYQARR